LIHGLGLDSSMWLPQCAALQSEFRVIRYDVRGFGSSSLPEAPYSHADDLMGLLEYLNVPNAHIVGLSMGGRLALRFALERPGAVKSLALIDPALNGFEWSQGWIQKMKAIVHAARQGEMSEAKRLWRTHELFAPACRNADLASTLEAMIDRYSGWHWANRDLERGTAPGSGENLSAVSVRTLVVIGELDLPDFHEIASRLCAGIPHADLAEIAGAGHMSTMEAPAAVNDRLLAHLSSAALP
jgi:pimeloyl-ACP methyl ester carboxylesterase